MKIQNWTVYAEFTVPENISGVKRKLGQVITSLDGTKEQAMGKACHKYTRNGITIGWRVTVKKGTVTNDNR